MMNPSNPNELSNKNAEASKQGVLLTDSAVSKPVATDQSMKPYASLGSMNEDGTVNIYTRFLTASRFQYKK
jgi:hypothetical protein